jgi:hypothetical protein
MDTDRRWILGEAEKGHFVGMAEQQVVMYRRRFVCALERLMEQRRGQDNPDYAKIRRGWCWGDRKFRKELLAQTRVTAKGHVVSHT